MNSLTNSSYVLDQVVHHGQAGPSAIALIHGATQISYGDLVSRVSQAAEALRAHRWEAGSTVMVALPRGPEQIMGLDPRSWTRCRFGYAASARVADAAAS